MNKKDLLNKKIMIVDEDGNTYEISKKEYRFFQKMLTDPDLEYRSLENGLTLIIDSRIGSSSAA